jgi:hypothetical protein
MFDASTTFRATAIRVVATEVIVVLALWLLGRAFGA